MTCWTDLQLTLFWLLLSRFNVFGPGQEVMIQFNFVEASQFCWDKLLTCLDNSICKDHFIWFSHLTELAQFLKRSYMCEPIRGIRISSKCDEPDLTMRNFKNVLNHLSLFELTKLFLKQSDSHDLQTSECVHCLSLLGLGLCVTCADRIGILSAEDCTLQSLHCSLCDCGCALGSRHND